MGTKYIILSQSWVVGEQQIYKHSTLNPSFTAFNIEHTNTPYIYIYTSLALGGDQHIRILFILTFKAHYKF